MCLLTLMTLLGKGNLLFICIPVTIAQPVVHIFVRFGKRRPILAKAL
jgi:hypothetical protein